MGSPYKQGEFGEFQGSPIPLDPDNVPIEDSAPPVPDDLIVLNSRNTVQELSFQINDKVDETAAPLTALWAAQEAFISEGDIRTFGLSQDSLVEINQSYAGWIKSDLKKTWLALGAVGAANIIGARGMGSRGIVNVFPNDPNIVPFPSLPGPSADSFIRARELDLVTRMTDSQRRAGQEIIQAGFDAGLNERVVARQVRSGVGLDAQQAKTLKKFRNQLIKDGVKPDLVRKRVAARVNKMRIIRAKRIARTEMTWGWNQGQLDAVKSYQQAGWIPRNVTVYKKWRKVLPVPECFCDALDGQIIGIETTFPGMTEKIPNVLTPPAHPNCACAIDIVIERALAA